MTDFLNLDGDIKKYFAEDAHMEANKKMTEMFSFAFSEARRVAVTENKNEVTIKISRDNWLEGYWSMIKSLRLKKRHPNLLSLTKFIMILVPIWIGYSFSDPITKYLEIIIGIIILASTFIIAERLESE
jgi:hypothetical protein